MSKKIIVKQRTDKEGKVTHYKYKDNERFTPIKTVNKMAKKDQIKDVHPYGDDAVRSDPNNKTKDNLGELPEG